MRLGTADVLVRAKTDEFNKDIDRSEKKVKGFAGQSSKALAGLSKSFVSLAGPAGVAAFTASLAGTIFVGAKFEKQMATVRGVMRASEKDFKLLSDAAKKMGATTEWSATQAAEALNFMGMAGWSVKDSIAALPEVLNLATSGSLDLGRASDIVTDSLTAMGLGVQDLSRFNDILTGTFTRTNTTVEMIGETLKYVAPIASAMGYEIEELAAMLGTLAQSGIKASDAGTDLRQAFIKNASAAKVLGTEADDLIGTLEAAKKAGWGVAEMTKHYGLIALKSVLKLTDNLDLYKELAEQLHNVAGETKELADIKLDTLIGDWAIFKSAIEGTGISIFEGINEPLRISLQTATELVNMIDVAAKYWAEKLAPITAAGVTREKIEDVREEIKKLEGELDNSTGWLNFWKGAGYSEKAEAKLKNLQLQLSILQKTLKDFEEEEKEDKDDKKKPSPPPSPPPLPDDSWIKNMQAQEAFAIKMAESEQERLSRRYELEQEINAKIHDELLSDTEFRLQELDKQFLAADSFVKNKAMLDEWYIKNYAEIIKNQELITIEQNQRMLENTTSVADGMAEAWENYILQSTSSIQKVSELSISMAQNFASGVGDAYAQAIVYGKSLSESFADLTRELAAQVISSLVRIGVERLIQFAASKIFSTAEATSRMAALSAETFAGAFAATVAIPVVGPAMAPAVAAASTATMLAGATGAGATGAATGMAIASYDQGGISRAQGVYQTGNIDEAHVPLPGGGKIPVQISGDNKKQGQTFIVHLENPVFQDLATQQQVFAQIANVISRQVAPEAIIENYENDGRIRAMVRGGA